MSMKKETISIMGAGFHCVDIIRTESITKTALGGTAANVTAILSCLGQDASFLCSNYMGKWGEWLKHELTQRGINTLSFSTSRIPAPRIIEYLKIETGQHNFQSICPVCGTKISRCILPNKSHISDKIIFYAKQANVFFFDRLSPGIKEIVDCHFSGWNYYEPNTCRNYQVFIDTAKASDIVKFSNSRIYDTYINRMLNDLQESKVRLIISTMGAKGFCFSCRQMNGLLCDWITVKPAHIAPIVDDTGAGDWFSAIFLLTFLHQYPKCVEIIDMNILKKAFDISKKVAALKCGFVGVHGIFQDNKAKNTLKSMLDVDIQNLLETPIEWGDGCYFCGV